MRSLVGVGVGLVHGQGREILDQHYATQNHWYVPQCGMVRITQAVLVEILNQTRLFLD
jgi:hypothetical protein